MPETASFYFFLAQLQTLLTASLRLGFAFLLLSWWSTRNPLSLYWSRWSWIWGVLGTLSGAGLWWALPRSNPFVDQGLLAAAGLLMAGSCLWWSQSRGAVLRRLGLWLSVILGGSCLWFLSFSRSDKDVFSILLALPLAIALSYFPLCYRASPAQRKSFHGFFLLSLVPCLGVYYGWMYPLIKHIPAAGEFYPYVNLYDWILPLFVILYSGNLYIEYWLRKAPRTLLTVWNYPVASLAIVGQWLNTQILDTLAL